MATTPTEVIAALEAALAAAPGETALRLHLADLLTTAGDHARALHHVRAILATDPGHVPALKLFARLQSAASTREPDASADEDDAPAATGKSNVVQLSVLAGGRKTKDADSPFFEIERPEITLADVAGMEKVKERLVLSFLAPMKQPELRRMYGKKLRGGLLL